MMAIGGLYISSAQRSGVRSNGIGEFLGKTRPDLRGWYIREHSPW